MSLQRMVLASLFVGVVAVCPSYAGLIIDSFDDAEEGVWPVTLTAFGHTDVVDGDVMGVIGGWRETRVRAIDIGTEDVDKVEANISSTSGILDYASSVGAEGRVSLLYRGDPLVQHLHADLSSEALIRIELADFDLAFGSPMRVAVVLSAGGGWPPISPILWIWASEPGPQFLDFAFADFFWIENVDLADLDNIEVTFLPAPGTDFQVERITTVVPEPATLFVLGLGGLLGMKRARSRRKSSTTRGAAILVALVGCTLFWSVAPAKAQEHSQSLYLKQGTVDTSAGTNLAVEAANLAGQTGRFVLQLEGPITPDRRSSLSYAGVVLESYIPSNAYVVTLDGADGQKLAGLSFVRWVGPFQKEWKLDPELGQREFQSQYRIELAEQGLSRVVIILFPGEELSGVLPELGARGGN